MSISGKDEIDKELEDIHEDEAVSYDSDGVARSHSPGRPNSSCGGSVGSVGSGGGSSKGKRRSWKKPKDKPKRPLSAYNIFFKHERSRIVDGKTQDATAEETVRSIELILSTSRETRRHRKTHGRISFGDLARRIADKWKTINPDQKAIFERYAELDMRRYRREVQLWKERKEVEALGGKVGSGQESSLSDSVSDYEYMENGGSHDAWAPRKNLYDNMNSSFSSVDSEVSFDRLPMAMQLQMMQQQQQRQQLMQQNQMQNSNFAMHASMPNLGRSSMNNTFGGSSIGMGGGFGGGGGGGIPNFVQSGGIGDSYEQELSTADLMAANNASMTNNMFLGLQQQQQQQQHQQQQQGLQQGMVALHHSFSGRPSGRMGRQMMENQIQNSVPFTIGSDAGSQHFTHLQPDAGFDSPEAHSNRAFSFHEVGSPQANLDPVPFNEVFPDDRGNSRSDLENYLSNLDLSNV
jgi:hypothetical protein